MVISDIKSLEDIDICFPDELSAKKYFSFIRWGKWAICPHCGNEKCYIIENGEKYKCANKKCHKKFSYQVKTLLQSSNIEAVNYIKILFLWVKTRGRISSYELCKSIGLAEKNEFFLREKLNFVWGKVERGGKSNVEIMESLFKQLIFNYDSFNEYKSKPFYKSPYHIPNDYINDWSDFSQYNILLRYTRYYINVYCHWIFMDFASPEDILSETFIYMKDAGIKEYDTEIVLKCIWKISSKMWYDFLNKNPKHSEYFRNKNKRIKEESRRNLKKSYIVSLIKSSKEGAGKTSLEIRNDIKLMEMYKNKLIEKRKRKKGLYDFESYNN